jgi:hypothetical protein
MGMGIAWPSQRAGFAAAFDAQVSGTIEIGMFASDWLLVRGTAEYQVFNFDRRRFFESLGLPDVDLSTQLGAGLEQWHLSFGTAFMPWRTASLAPYVFAAGGYLFRDSNATILVTMYCGFGGPDDPFGGPAEPQWVDACDAARPEARLTDSGPAVSGGVGIQWEVERRWLLFAEVSYVTAQTTPGAELFPMRFGWLAAF